MSPLPTPNVGPLGTPLGFIIVSHQASNQPAATATRNMRAKQIRRFKGAGREATHVRSCGRAVVADLQVLVEAELRGEPRQLERC